MGNEDRIEDDVRKDLHEALDQLLDCVNEKWNDLMGETNEENV